MGSCCRCCVVVAGGGLELTLQVSRLETGETLSNLEDIGLYTNSVECWCGWSSSECSSVLGFGL